MAALAVLLSACTGGASARSNAGTSLPNAGATTNATAAGHGSKVLIAISDQPPGWEQQESSAPWNIRLVRPDGSSAQQLTIKAGAAVLTARGQRIFVKEGSQLKAVHRDGSVETLGDLGTTNIHGFAASPDGSHWMWGTLDVNHGQVHVAGDGMPPRVVIESQDDRSAVQPFSWTKAGGFVAHESTLGLGDREFQPATGAVEMFDPTTFLMHPVPHTDQCAFSDLAPDGTLACIAVQNASPALELVSPDGSTQTIPLNKASFRTAGDAFFSPDGQQVTVAGATGSGNESGPNQYVTDIVAVKDRSIRRFADHLRPSPELQSQTWLSDGSLVLWRLDGAAGGPGGVFVVSASGRSQMLSPGFGVGTLLD